MAQCGLDQGPNRVQLWAAAFAALTILAPASSQAQETRCHEVGWEWVCKTTPAKPSGMDAYLRAQRDAYESVARVARAREAQEAYDAARARSVEFERLSAYEQAEEYSKLGQCGDAARAASILGSQVQWDIEQRCRGQQLPPQQ